MVGMAIRAPDGASKYKNYEYQHNNQSHLVLAPVRMVVRAEEGLLLRDQVR